MSCDSQENRPKGTSILQLAVSDRDASHNGPPFTFAIVEGNEGGVFHINQQGALVTTGVLSRKTKEHYLLQAQVSRRAEVRRGSAVCIDLNFRASADFCLSTFFSLLPSIASPSSLLTHLKPPEVFY